MKVQDTTKGLNKDYSPINQPKGTYTFALNAVSNQREGDFVTRSVEPGSEATSFLKVGYTPIGKVYLTDSSYVVFSVSADETLSEIGLFDKSGTYTEIVNTDLQFKLEYQIDAEFRLRRGCERIIYFTDNYNKPRTFNLDKLSSFKTGGDWDPNKFNLFKVYNNIPLFNSIEVGRGGTLKPGSYNFAIQYLDEDLNPTEWITVTDTVIIYNDNITSTPFSEIRGSTNLKNNYQDFGVSNKSVLIQLSNLDNSFPFYRIAHIQANSGNGSINEITLSQELSTKVPTYRYTGEASVGQTTIEDIATFNNIVEKAAHIEQIENRLILGNLKGKPINWCKLQKYASRIKADLVTEEVILNVIDTPNNPKRGQLHNEKVGYMPGEIYSFGIVYILEDGTTSPVFHIPGRESTYSSQMSANNTLENTVYLSRDCDDGNYWGYDSQGGALEGEKVRHHRFPSRAEVAKPLITKDESGDAITSSYIYLEISGEIDGGYSELSVDYRVKYEEGGVPTELDFSFLVADYDPLVGIPKVLVTSSIQAITNLQVVEIDTGLNEVDPLTNSGLTYDLTIETVSSITDDSIYKSEIFGISFSDIELPLSVDTKGEKIIGYYIVRNERNEENKTILDSGILTPLIEEKRDGVSKFVAHGHLTPQTDDLKTDILALIHPEHRFGNREYQSVTEYSQEGVYTIGEPNTSSITIQDVQPGTSYDASVNQRRERDSDGFDLRVLTRSANLEYVPQQRVFASEADIAETFYLDTLFSKTIASDINTDRKEVYNLSADNKIGILRLNKEETVSNLKARLPYVILKRNLSDPYSTFSVSPYFKETTNPVFFGVGTSSSTEIFNGDSYISSMRYISSSFYDIRIKSRRTKSGILNFTLGVLSALAGAALIITGVGAVAGVALIGFGITQISTGLKKEQLGKVYQELYEQGLKDTVNDDFTNSQLSGNPDDDEIQWFVDCLPNLWFESSVNMNWRVGSTIGITDFLNSPSSYNDSELTSYGVEKVTELDAEADGGRNYQGYTKAEIYEINPDYRRRQKEKVYFAIGIEYDCCSECLEEFPHRVAYSQQSFQEELTDNFRVFLPNNYRDIEGDTGVLTDLFRIQNNLYLHTEEGLWHLPQNLQERVTGDIITFIGTGDFFSIPPRKVADDDTNHSAGSLHKWATIKTPFGVLFVSYHQKSIYLFDGNSLKNLSLLGLEQWSKEEVEIVQNTFYYNSNKRDYPYFNNPSNPLGLGFTSTYDSLFERLLLTKKDFILTSSSITNLEDYELCSSGGSTTVFNDFLQTIATEEAQGWEYLGIDNCQLQFQKPGVKTIDVEQPILLPSNADIHLFLDTSGSFGNVGGPCLLSIQNAVDSWAANYLIENPDWTGVVYTYQDSSERWLNYINIVLATTYSGLNPADLDIVIVSFCNEAGPAYHPNTLDSPITAPTANWDVDYNNFITVHGQVKSFVGINYPIVFGADSGSCFGAGSGDLESSRTFLQHSVASMYGLPMTSADLTLEGLYNRNLGFEESEWNIFLDNIQTLNPYQDDGLKNYGWVGKWDRYALPDATVITEEQFSADIEELLLVDSGTEIIQVEVPTILYKTVSGVPLENVNKIDYSWTLSYSVKENNWTSFHSYMPNFYMHTPNQFYSWANGVLSKHNIRGLYQSFAGQPKPFIIEYVLNEQKVVNFIKDYLKIIVHAEVYDSVRKEFYRDKSKFFTKLIAYNSRQSTGELNIVTKDSLEDSYYLSNQLSNSLDSIIADYNEDFWTLNELRDYVTAQLEGLFKKDKTDLQEDYFIDKIPNVGIIDYDKPWQEIEPLRDRYLVLRFIFDTFTDVKLSVHYSIEDEVVSIR